MEKFFNNIHIRLRPFIGLLKGHIILLVAYSFIVASQPMPMRIGAVELLMGFGLIVGSLFLIPALYSSAKKNPLDASIITALALFIIIVPFLNGIIIQHGVNNIARDLLPIMFLIVIPLEFALSTKTSMKEPVSKAILAAVLSVGVISAVEFLYRVMYLYGSPGRFVSAWSSYFIQIHGHDISSSSQGVSVSREDQIVLFLKVYDPAILFSAVYCLNRGLRDTIMRNGKVFRNIVALSAGSICAYCYFIMGLRAHVASIIVSVVTYAVYISIKRGIKKTKIISMGLGAFAIMAFFTHDELLMMIAKQVATGTNGKLNEWVAVVKEISITKGALFGGIGWGGVFLNPVVADNTRFTHSLLSFLLLKSGVIGLSIFTLYYTLFMKFIGINKKLLFSADGLLVALPGAATIVIALLFQPTYKMLSFSFILSLVLVQLSRNISGGQHVLSTFQQSEELRR